VCTPPGGGIILLQFRPVFSAILNARKEASQDEGLDYGFGMVTLTLFEKEPAQFMVQFSQRARTSYL
jgi:hypothetical protein